MQYCPNCPNWQVAAEHLEEALAVRGRSSDVRLRLVADPDEAERIGFRGSPTILVDGRDPCDGGVPGTFACRSYLTEKGRRGAPSVDQLVGRRPRPARCSARRPDRAVRAVLDTSALIGDEPPPDDAEAAISVASITELHFGVLVAADDDERARRMARLAVVEATFDPQSISVDVARE